MERKSHMDLAGAVALTVFAVVLGLNQVVIKLSNGGLSAHIHGGVALGTRLSRDAGVDALSRGASWDTARSAFPGACAGPALYL